MKFQPSPTAREPGAPTFGDLRRWATAPSNERADPGETHTHTGERRLCTLSQGKHSALPGAPAQAHPEQHFSEGRSAITLVSEFFLCPVPGHGHGALLDCSGTHMPQRIAPAYTPNPRQLPLQELRTEPKKGPASGCEGGHRARRTL